MVRSFPRTTHHPGPRVAVALLLAGLVSALLAALLPSVLPNAAAAPLDDRKAAVQKRLSQADKHLDESSAELTAATRALLRSRSDLVDARGYLAGTRDELHAARVQDRVMQQRLTAAEARLVQARAELVQGKTDVVEQEQELRRVVVASYQQGDPELLKLSMVFTTQDPAQLTGRWNANSTVANVESTHLDQLEAARVLLSVRQKASKAARIEVAVRRREAAENLVAKQQIEDRAQAAKLRVADLVAAKSQARTVAVKAKQDDLKELRRLQAERERIEKLILARASVGKGLTSKGGDGYLDYPVSAPVTSAYGWRTHPIWGYRSLHDGVDFGAGCGTPVRAAAPGKVIAAYYQTAWGNRIILDHGVHSGVGVATISNHLSSYASGIGVGSRVSRGQVVGYVGSTGWSTGCHLHYTVLNNGTAVDPVRWF